MKVSAEARCPLNYYEEYMNSKDKVYLAGPMEDLTKEEMKSWREYATEYLSEYDIVTLDPTRRVNFHETLKIEDLNVTDQSVCRRVFKQDLQDIAGSSIILADVRRTKGRGIGTAMELMFAHTKNKIIILWTDEDDIPHPFYESIYTEKHSKLSDCLNAIVSYYQ